MRTWRGLPSPGATSPATSLISFDSRVRVCNAACHSGHVQTLYERVGGADGLLRLASAWHARVMADDVVSHAFSHGFHPEHTERLAAYWAEALGGPSTYSDSYGDETSVVRMHSGNGAHEDMDRRAIACFDQALADVGIAGDEALRRSLHDYFEWSTTTTMSRYHRSADDVPDGLRIPQWSWDGLVTGTGPDGN
jgi:hemoglobin